MVPHLRKNKHRREQKGYLELASIVESLDPTKMTTMGSQLVKRLEHVASMQGAAVSGYLETASIVAHSHGAFISRM
jgi:triacylglycerol esterase/lipase EstA (alpha/beta hydrolase family)